MTVSRWRDQNTGKTREHQRRRQASTSWGERPLRKPALVSLPQPSGIQSCKEISFCCFNSPSSGAMLWLHSQTKTQFLYLWEPKTFKILLPTINSKNTTFLPAHSPFYSFQKNFWSFGKSNLCCQNLDWQHNKTEQNLGRAPSVQVLYDST